MGYTFGFADEASSTASATKLNEECRATAAAWRAACAAAAPLGRGGAARDLIWSLVDEADGAELFFFVTPPRDARKMIRRLCAARRGRGDLQLRRCVQLRRSDLCAGPVLNDGVVGALVQCGRGERDEHQ